MANSLRGRNMDFFQYDFFGELYAGTAVKVGRYGFPQLAEEDYIPSKQVRTVNYLLSTNDLNKYWMHCFCDDYQFERLWTGLDFYLHYILQLQGFISTDFSLYRDYRDDALIWNCYRNRCMAYAIQQAGGCMIPTASYVAFLQEKPSQKRSDLSVEGVHTEVKGMSSLSTNKVANNIKEAFEQVSADNGRYDPETHRDGQVIILSKYPNIKTAYKTVRGGYRKAKGKGYVQGDVYLMHGGKLYKIGGK